MITAESSTWRASFYSSRKNGREYARVCMQMWVVGGWVSGWVGSKFAIWAAGGIEKVSLFMGGCLGVELLSGW